MGKKKKGQQEASRAKSEEFQELLSENEGSKQNKKKNKKS